MTVAPLRERKEDIPLLAAHFIDSSVRDFGCAKPILTRLGVENLQKYHWPGNIRELRNVIERAVILAQGGPIAFDVPINGASIELPALKLASNGQEEAEFLTEAEIRRRDCENIFAVLQKTGWKIKGTNGAARLLGVKPTTLISRIKRLGLVRPV
jgi:transcriptional regulator with GAF, ATPase, and Fis domain